jgi:hypothetical protein
MRPLSRRSFLGLLVGAAGIALTGCAPARLLLALDRPRPAAGLNGRDGTLAAFALTVVPGIAPDHPHLTRVYGDRAYPFARARDFFVADLDRRARRLEGAVFARLGPEERRAVVADGLAARGITRKVYDGAVFLTQVALYAGIYNDAAGCALIDFPGGGSLPTFEEHARMADATFLPGPAAVGGNPL